MTSSDCASSGFQTYLYVSLISPSRPTQANKDEGLTSEEEWHDLRHSWFNRIYMRSGEF